MTDSLFALDGVIRPYAWGSKTAIPRLLGVAPTDEPAAELWFGAHPDDPCSVPVLGVSLDAAIAADPQRLLGSAVRDRFGDQLPFLLKVLAAEHALSLQVHPTLDQARAGFADEQARGVPLGSPSRNYRDANHKPELICALTEFDALCGFRPVDETLRVFDALAVAELKPYRDLLAGPDGLRSAFTALLTASDPAPLVAAVVAACERLDDPSFAAVTRATLLAAGDFPGDVGAVLALLLNAVRLVPGEAIYLAAGNVHAYLRGLGIEIMATSDNVLRCGLTPKHVDVPELLRVTDFTALAEPRFTATDGRRDLDRPPAPTFRPPVDDFALSVVEVRGAEALPTGGPSIVLCTEGQPEILTDGEILELRPGHAVFVSADVAEIGLTGVGRVCVATTGLQSVATTGL